MSSAKLTLYSFAQWMDFNQKDLFGLLQLPTGIDKDTLTDNILIRGGEFEVVYSDPEFMAYCIGAWSRKWYRTFDKWITALNIEYDPLENYDRKEDYTDSTNRGVKTQARRDSGNTRTFNNEDKQTLNTEDKETLNTEDKRTANLVNEQSVSAYDSSSYQPANKSSDTGTDTMNHTGTDTMNHTGTIKDEYGEGSSGNETENIKLTHDGRIHGNIGVTTSQQMLESELDIAKWNIYEHITDVFLEEFIIPIYS